jgi:hypothetical protein
MVSWDVVRRAPISSLGAAVIGVASIVIVWQSSMSRAGTDWSAGVIVAAISAVAVLYSMTCLSHAKRFERENRQTVRRIFLCGLIVSELFIQLSEIAWLNGHFMVSETRSQVEQARVTSEISIIEKAQRTLDTLKKKTFRGEDEINGAIDSELVRAIDLGHGSSSTLARLTTDCTDKRSTYATQCGEVFKLRQELAESRKAKTDFEQAKIEISTHVVDASQVTAPANAGALFLSTLFGMPQDWGTGIFIGICVIFVACLRIGIGPVLLDPIEERREDSHDVMAAIRLAPTGPANDTKPVEMEPDTPKIEALPKKTKLAEPSRAAGVLSEVAATMARKNGNGLPGLPTGSIEGFYSECTRPSDGGKHTTGVYYRTYRQWCERKGLAPVSLPVFTEESKNKRLVRKLAKPVAGRVVYEGRTILPRLLAGGLDAAIAVA